MRYISIDNRKQVILKAIVNDYVQTAEPVGSSALAAKYHLGVKSATIRNEMAELSELGFLCQPHTSAGRIPSDLGYRYYVDRLMDALSLGHISDSILNYELLRRQSEIDILISETCRLLSRMANYTSVASKPTLRNAFITQVNVAKVGNTRLLVVIVLDNGQVIHQFISGASIIAMKPDHAQNFLTEYMVGKSVSSAAQPLPLIDESEPADLVDLLKNVTEILKNQTSLESNNEVHLEGTNYMMQQPEFKDLDRLEAMLGILEERKAICELLSAASKSPSVTVLIGSENPISGMHDCSFVGATYKIRNKVAGTIGVLGPTRMDYPKAVSAVSLIAESLGDLLTELSLP